MFVNPSSAILSYCTLWYMITSFTTEYYMFISITQQFATENKIYKTHKWSKGAFLLNHYKVGFLPFFSPSPLLLPSSPSSPPPSRQSNLLILNISAKSSRIFTKFWGKLPLGILRWLKQKNNEYINKQTNKQTNKHFPV